MQIRIRPECNLGEFARLSAAGDWLRFGQEWQEYDDAVIGENILSRAGLELEFRLGEPVITEECQPESLPTGDRPEPKPKRRGK